MTEQNNTGLNKGLCDLQNTQQGGGDFIMENKTVDQICTKDGALSESFINLKRRKPKTRNTDAVLDGSAGTTPRVTHLQMTSDIHLMDEWLISKVHHTIASSRVVPFH